MTLTDRAKLTFPAADVDGDGDDETGVFEFAGDLEFTTSKRTGFLVGGRGSRINAVIQSFVGDNDEKDGSFFIGLNSGARTVEVAFRGWQGSEDSAGNALQWGDGSSDASDPTDVNQADATGCTPQRQVDVLMHYLATVRIDSDGNLATLEHGEYSSSGIFEPIDVVIESPNFVNRNDDTQGPQAFDGSITFIKAKDLKNAYSATQRNSK